MKLIIDAEARTISRLQGNEQATADLFSREAFEWLSEQWLKVGWACRYYQSFSWLGVPIMQLPEDLVRVQEVIYRLRPTVIVETGVAYGGSLLFYASVLKLTGGRRVIGIELQVPKENRRVLDQHVLAPFIDVIDGNSVDPAVVARVRSSVSEADRVLVVLDSCHTKSHVLGELEAYYPLVTPGSYIIATDGIMRDLADVPGGAAEWQSDNPAAAAAEFAARHPEFVLERPAWTFNTSALDKPVTYWPQAWLRNRGELASPSNPRCADL